MIKFSTMETSHDMFDNVHFVAVHIILHEIIPSAVTVTPSLRSRSSRHSQNMAFIH
jgi:hypothetical protein